jgi:broad specificity phosphatase PhoE
LTTATLYLVRHGQTLWNQERRIQGHQDSPLSPEGREQAVRLGHLLRRRRLTVAWTSPSPRALTTARLILGGDSPVPVRVDPRLQEIGHGAWEGLIGSEVAARWPDLYRLYRRDPEHFARAPGGESFQDVQARMLAALHNIARQAAGGPVLVVTHGVALRLALLALDGLPLRHLWDPPHLLPTSVTEVSVEAGGWRVVRRGDLPHWAPPGA